jgi:hypothetical protein
MVRKDAEQHDGLQVISSSGKTVIYRGRQGEIVAVSAPFR